MKKILISIMLIITCGFFTGCDESGKLSVPGLSQQEIAAGLKNALVTGTSNAVNIVGVLDGYYSNPEISIPLPEEAQVVKEFFERMNWDHNFNEFEKRLNRAAEDAAGSAVEVFATAITQMTISDAVSILQGSDNAATMYLDRTTSPILYEKFYPVIENSTSRIRLAEIWTPLASAYNTAIGLIGGQPVNVDLNDYVTGKALDGLFVMIAKEEKKIRTDPAARVNEILQKVFGSNLNPHNPN